MSIPIPIKYVKNSHGFSDSNNDINKYLFELIINGKEIGKKYFRNLEEIKYSHLIQINHKIKLSDIDSYKASISMFPCVISYEVEGTINKNESCSNKRGDNIYIEFTQNDNGYALCYCFYTGLDQNKLVVSPPF